MSFISPSLCSVFSVSKYSYSAPGFLGTDIAHSICESPPPPLIHIPSTIKAMHNTTKLLIPSGPPAPPSPSIPIKSEARGRPHSLTRTLRSSWALVQERPLCGVASSEVSVSHPVAARPAIPAHPGRRRGNIPSSPSGTRLTRPLQGFVGDPSQIPLSCVDYSSPSRVPGFALRCVALRRDFTLRPGQRLWYHATCCRTYN